MDTHNKLKGILGTASLSGATRRDSMAETPCTSSHPALVSRRNCLKLLTGGALMAATQTAFASTGLSALQALVTNKTLSAENGASQAEISETAAKIQALQSLERTMSLYNTCLLYTSPSPRDATLSRMPSSA